MMFPSSKLWADLWRWLRGRILTSRYAQMCRQPSVLYKQAEHSSLCLAVTMQHVCCYSALIITKCCTPQYQSVLSGCRFGCGYTVCRWLLQMICWSQKVSWWARVLRRPSKAVWSKRFWFAYNRLETLTDCYSMDQPEVFGCIHGLFTHVMNWSRQLA